VVDFNPNELWGGSLVMARAAQAIEAGLRRVEAPAARLLEQSLLPTADRAKTARVAKLNASLRENRR
jgi:hypothetical protein